MLVFEKINKIHKPLARLNTQGKKKIGEKITNIRNTEEYINIDPRDIKLLMRGYCKTVLNQ